MPPVDPWERAAECERSANATVDAHRKAILHKLRDLWIALGNERCLIADEDMASHIEAINRMHLEVIPAAGAA
jgi:hypothetical protein